MSEAIIDTIHYANVMDACFDNEYGLVLLLKTIVAPANLIHYTGENEPIDIPVSYRGTKFNHLAKSSREEQYVIGSESDTVGVLETDRQGIYFADDYVIHGEYGPILSMDISPLIPDILVTTNPKTICIQSYSGYYGDDFPITILSTESYGQMNHCKFSPHNKLLLITTSTDTIYFWNIDQQSVTKEIKTHHKITCLDLSYYRNILAVGLSNNTIMFYDIETGLVVNKKLKGHLGEINNICFLKDDANLLVSCSEDRTVRIWDIRNGKQLNQITHDNGVKKVVHSNDNKLFASFDRSGNVKIWDITILVEKTKPLEETYTEWQEICSHLSDQYRIDELRTIAESIGIKTLGESKDRLCELLAKSFEMQDETTNLGNKKITCENSNILGDDYDEIPDDQILVDEHGRCFSLMEIYAIMDKSDGIDPYTRRPFSELKNKDGEKLLDIYHQDEKQEILNAILNIDQIKKVHKLKTYAEYFGEKLRNSIDLLVEKINASSDESATQYFSPATFYDLCDQETCDNFYGKMTELLGIEIVRMLYFNLGLDAPKLNRNMDLLDYIEIMLNIFNLFETYMPDLITTLQLNIRYIFQGHGTFG